MAIIVQSPGSCGEFLQGSYEGTPFLVTCPINRYSYAYTSDIFGHNGTKQLPPKSLAAYKAVLRHLQLQIHRRPTPSIFLESHILKGKGMASSTADISAIALATAIAHERTLTMDQLVDIALSIEPSDATFYPGVVAFDYLKGSLLEPLGKCPPMHILIFDEGGMIDTVKFNKQENLHKKILAKEPIIKKAYTLFKKGMVMQNIAMMAQAATMSAFANQTILPKKELEAFHQLGSTLGALGTIIAHSGSIMGYILPPEFDEFREVRLAVTQTLPNLTFIDCVKPVNEGITYKLK